MVSSIILPLMNLVNDSDMTLRSDDDNDDENKVPTEIATKNEKETIYSFSTPEDHNIGPRKALSSGTKVYNIKSDEVFISAFRSVDTYNTGRIPATKLPVLLKTWWDFECDGMTSDELIAIAMISARVPKEGHKTLQQVAQVALEIIHMVGKTPPQRSHNAIDDEKHEKKKGRKSRSGKRDTIRIVYNSMGEPSRVVVKNNDKVEKGISRQDSTTVSRTRSGKKPAVFVPKNRRMSSGASTDNAVVVPRERSLQSDDDDGYHHHGTSRLSTTITRRTGTPQNNNDNISTFNNQPKEVDYIGLNRAIRLARELIAVKFEYDKENKLSFSNVLTTYYTQLYGANKVAERKITQLSRLLRKHRPHSSLLRMLSRMLALNDDRYDDTKETKLDDDLIMLFHSIRSRLFRQNLIVWGPYFCSPALLSSLTRQTKGSRTANTTTVGMMKRNLASRKNVTACFHELVLVKERRFPPSLVKDVGEYITDLGAVQNDIMTGDDDDGNKGSFAQGDVTVGFLLSGGSGDSDTAFTPNPTYPRDHFRHGSFFLPNNQQEALVDVDDALEGILNLVESYDEISTVKARGLFGSDAVPRHVLVARPRDINDNTTSRSGKSNAWNSSDRKNWRNELLQSLALLHQLTDDLLTTDELRTGVLLRVKFDDIIAWWLERAIADDIISTTQPQQPHPAEGNNELWELTNVFCDEPNSFVHYLDFLSFLYSQVMEHGSAVLLSFTELKANLINGKRGMERAKYYDLVIYAKVARPLAACARRKVRYGAPSYSFSLPQRLGKELLIVSDPTPCLEQWEEYQRSLAPLDSNDDTGLIVKFGDDDGEGRNGVDTQDNRAPLHIIEMGSRELPLKNFDDMNDDDTNCLFDRRYTAPPVLIASQQQVFKRMDDINDDNYDKPSLRKTSSAPGNYYKKQMAGPSPCNRSRASDPVKTPVTVASSQSGLDSNNRGKRRPVASSDIPRRHKTKKMTTNNLCPTPKLPKIDASEKQQHPRRNLSRKSTTLKERQTLKLKREYQKAIDEQIHKEEASRIEIPTTIYTEKDYSNEVEGDALIIPKEEEKKPRRPSIEDAAIIINEFFIKVVQSSIHTKRKQQREARAASKLQRFQRRTIARIKRKCRRREIECRRRIIASAAALTLQKNERRRQTRKRYLETLRRRWEEMERRRKQMRMVAASRTIQRAYRKISSARVMLKFHDDKVDAEDRDDDTEMEPETRLIIKQPTIPISATLTATMTSTKKSGLRRYLEYLRKTSGHDVYTMSVIHLLLTDKWDWPPFFDEYEVDLLCVASKSFNIHRNLRLHRMVNKIDFEELLRAAEAIFASDEVIMKSPGLLRRGRGPRASLLPSSERSSEWYGGFENESNDENGLFVLSLLQKLTRRGGYSNSPSSLFRLSERPRTENVKGGSSTRRCGETRNRQRLDVVIGHPQLVKYRITR